MSKSTMPASSPRQLMGRIKIWQHNWISLSLKNILREQWLATDSSKLTTTMSFPGWLNDVATPILS